ncbi:MAG: translation initiation factor IF-2 [Anaerolineae bacterium]|jgi:translation initiation factor IF-2|nr:translation initiation factor IF-2 [Anaerolineae bacterium]
MAQEKQVVLVPDYLSVRQLAELIKASPIEVMKKLISNGIMASINQQIDYDTAAIVLEDLGFEAQSESAASKAAVERDRVENSTQTWRKIYTTEKPENLAMRPPIVTILGHVDHGKTTLLDTIRKAKVAESESGGITQHIGAYRVEHNGQALTFLDTPGHEAFTAMRARGAQGADIVILVVAADDGVMPTTREALNHAQAANVPIVVAITKIDKRNANIELVKKQLDDLGLHPDEWGGTVMMIPVSAIKREGIDDLLEALLLTAEGYQIVANPKSDASGVVIESQVDPRQGTLATLLVLNGSLQRGDVVVAGTSHGRIKAMFDHNGKTVNSASPSVPVRVLGLDAPPQPGTQWEKVKNEKIARGMVDELQESAASTRNQAARPVITLEDIFNQYALGAAKDLNLIIKVDVQGSLEPILNTLNDISNKSKEVKLKILLSGVGNVSENDTMLATASGAIVIGFKVDVDSAARRTAEAKGVEIRQYDVIYKLFEDVELALKGMLEPVYEPKTIGVAEVRQVFRISKVGAIAGSIIREGEARRNAKARVKRGGKVMADEATVSSLKRFNEDVREVRTGFECGIGLSNFNDFENGDLIEFYVMERVN